MLALTKNQLLELCARRWVCNEWKIRPKISVKLHCFSLFSVGRDFNHENVHDNTTSKKLSHIDVNKEAPAIMPKQHNKLSGSKAISVIYAIDYPVNCKTQKHYSWMVAILISLTLQCNNCNALSSPTNQPRWWQHTVAQPNNTIADGHYSNFLYLYYVL